MQVIPHITDEIKERIRRLGREDVDVVIVEVGGTVGDIEIVPFLEAIRQFRRDVGRDNVCYVHLTLVPHSLPSGEQKTKPTQHSVTELRGRGIQPDVIVCRSHEPISENLKRKISLLCDVSTDAVVSDVDAENIYEIPLGLARGGPRRHRLPHPAPRRGGPPDRPLELGGAGRAGCAPPPRSSASGSSASTSTFPTPTCRWSRRSGTPASTTGPRSRSTGSQAEEVTGMLAAARLDSLDGIVIPGGFGERGLEGKIAAAGYAREHAIPCLGLCLGLHMMVIELARTVVGLERANSRELDPTTPHPVIDLMDDQVGVEDKGATMRLGACLAQLQPGSQVAAIYGSEVVSERHRHRYEVNPRYRDRLVERRARAARGPRPTAAWWSSSSCPATPSGSPPRPTRSSRAGRTGPTRCFASWSGRRSTERTSAPRGSTTSTMSPPESDAPGPPGEAIEGPPARRF